MLMTMKPVAVCIYLSTVFFNSLFLEKCDNDGECQYWSFYAKKKYCVILKSCEEKRQKNYISGPKGCPPPPTEFKCPGTIIVDHMVYNFSSEVNFTPCSSALDKCLYTNYGLCFCIDTENGAYVPRRLDVNNCPEIRGSSPKEILQNNSGPRDLSGFYNTSLGYLPREDWDDQNLKDFRISKIILYEQPFGDNGRFIFSIKNDSRITKMFICTYHHYPHFHLHHNL